MYAKVFSQIYDSSIVERPEVRFTFMDFLILADLNGVVDMTHQAIARRTNRPIELIRETITILEATDLNSRDASQDGRRIERLDEHRNWGWQILNYKKYREIRSREDQREMIGGEAMRAAGKVYYAVSAELGRVKIGFSINPWARIKELSAGTTDLKLVATERGSLRLEKKRHAQFGDFLVEREWFKYEGDLKDFIAKLASENADNRSSLRSATPPLLTSHIQIHKQKEKKESTVGAEEIYSAYPRKVSKKAALLAISKAMSKVDHADLLRLTIDYALARKACEERFTPHAATWFNGERYNDPPESWKNGEQAKSASNTKTVSVSAQEWGTFKDLHPDDQWQCRDSFDSSPQHVRDKFLKWRKNAATTAV